MARHRTMARTPADPEQVSVEPGAKRRRSTRVSPAEVEFVSNTGARRLFTLKVYAGGQSAHEHDGPMGPGDVVRVVAQPGASPDDVSAVEAACSAPGRAAAVTSTPALRSAAAPVEPDVRPGDSARQVVEAMAVAGRGVDDVPALVELCGRVLSEVGL